MGYSLWGHREPLNTTEQLITHAHTEASELPLSGKGVGTVCDFLIGFTQHYFFLGKGGRKRLFMPKTHLKLSSHHHQAPRILTGRKKKKPHSQ